MSEDALAMLPVMLTLAMFLAREPLLGFPSAIFWGIFGGYCFTQSAAEWDIYYFLFFASAFGMTIFSMLAAYAIRRRDLAGPDADEGKYVDEEADTEKLFGGDGEKKSKRTQRVRQKGRNPGTETETDEDWEM